MRFVGGCSFRYSAIVEGGRRLQLKSLRPSNSLESNTAVAFPNPGARSSFCAVESTGKALFALDLAMMKKRTYGGRTGTASLSLT